MNELNQKVKNNILANIRMKFATGKSKISNDKLIKYIEDKFNIDVDEDMLSDILSDDSIVNNIDDEMITLGTDEELDKQNIDDEIHDNAVEQSMDNLKQESVADAINHLKAGMNIDSTQIKLEESNLYYPLHMGALKAKRNYIIGSIIPKKDLNESLVECKIENTGLYIELPIKCFVK